MNAARVALLLAAGSTLAAACGHSGKTTSHTTGSGGNTGTRGTAGAGGTVGTGGAGGTATTTTTSTGTACGTDAWLTYNHDAARSGASDGCVSGPLTTTWRYVPAPPAGKKLNDVFNAVAQPDGVFLAWSASDDPYLGTTAADRVDLTGNRVWTFDSGTDSNLGNWPSIALGALILNDDGIYYLDLASGMKTAGNGVDNWGQTLTDGTNLYAVNDSHVDGPGIYVGAYDATCKQLWAANKYGMCRIDAGDVAGGLALDGGVLFYAPSYSPGMGVSLGFSSGLYAFDPATGKQQWFQATTPTSSITAGGGLLYLIEGGDKLVARKQADGSVAWSATTTGAGTQAPVRMAAGKVVIATAQSVSAYDAATGAAAWSTPLTSPAAQAFDLMFSGGCVAGSGQWSGNEFKDGGGHYHAGRGARQRDAGGDRRRLEVHVLSLSTGAGAWSGMPANAMGTVKNPTIVGHTVYVVDDGGLLSLQGM